MDKRLFEVCIPLLLILFVGRAMAQEPLPPMPPALPPIIEIDFDGVIGSIDAMFAGLTQSFAELPAAVVDQFFASFKGIAASFLESLLFLAKQFVVTNPDIAPMFPLWQLIVYIISLFYLMLFLVVGFLFLYSSFDAEKRVDAKKWFKSTVIMIAVVGASFYLYDLFLDLGAGVAGFLWSSEFETLFNAGELSSLNILLLMVYSGAVLLAFITFFIRHLFLLIGTAILPIALFLYFIQPLKAWGKMLLEIIFAAVLMQIIDVIIFIGAEAVWQQFEGLPDIAGWGPTMAFTLVAITNNAIIFFALLKAARTVNKEIPELVILAKTAGTAAMGAMA